MHTRTFAGPVTRFVCAQVKDDKLEAVSDDALKKLEATLEDKK